MSSGKPGQQGGGHGAAQGNGLKFSPWNLVLLVPLLILATPLYNFIEPRLFGLPVFYWAQFGFVIVGVLSVWVVYVKTKDVSAREDLPRRDLDEDEGEQP